LKLNTNPYATYFPKGELVIVKDQITGSNEFKLSWKFNISSLVPLSDQFIYVDAITGDIINNISLEWDSNTTSSADTEYSGSGITIISDSFAGGYRLKETRNGVKISTMDLNNSSNIADTVDFVNPINSLWTDGNWGSIAKDRCALDIHWATEKTLDFWRGPDFNRNSYDNNYGRVISGIHCNYDYANASWTPGENNHYFKFGDGGALFGPITSLDVFAHEFGHAIFEFAVGIYESNYSEIAALNEGLSDIWGAVIENATPKAQGDTDKECWKIGEELTSYYSCYRNIQSPNDSNSKDGPQPDTYEGDYWDDDDDCHKNSTVLSHWFYLLSEGGNDYNDNDNHYNVYGLGIDVAKLIVYELETNGLEIASTYSDAKDLSITAANAIFENSDLEEMQVRNAWYAVGFGSEPLQIDIIGNSSVCKYGAKFKIENVPAGCSVAWTCDSRMHLSSSSGDSIVVFADQSGTGGWVHATVSSSYSSVSLEYNDITINSSTPTISGSTLICSSGSTFTLSASCQYDSIRWTKDSFLNITSGQGTLSCTFAATGNGSSKIYATIYVSNTSITYSKSVWAGKPIFTSIAGPFPPYIYKGCTGQQYTFYAIPARNPLSQSTYQWMVEPGYLSWYFMYQYYDWVTIVFNDPSDYYQVIARASNTCGSSNWISTLDTIGYIEIMDCHYFSIYPNPASDYVTLILTVPEAEKEFVIPSEYRVQILNISGITYYSAIKAGDNVTIPIGNLKDGNYFVLITYGNKVESLPLIVKH
ncbi:MAG: M4 family metallopeptidase, partial [Bacteroidales bacterium]